MSVLIASKYWIHYLSVPKEPPREANGSRINRLVQGSLLPVHFCSCAIYICKRRQPRCFEAGLSLHSTNYPPFAWLLQLMLSSATLLQPFRSCQISLQKNTGLNGQPLRNFLTKLFGFSCFALFLKSHANLWSWSLYLGMYPPPGILTRKGLSSTEIRRDIYSPD